MTELVTIKVKRLPGYSGVKLPERQTKGAAGFDVCAANTETIVLQPGERMALPTGMALEIPEGFEVQVRPRSGLALKHGIILPNSPGTIDSDYRGELKIILMNLGAGPFEIKAGDRIAQLIIGRVIDAGFQFAGELAETDRGQGGFGSTGK